MSFQWNFTKSSIFAVKLFFSVVSWLEFSKILLKFHKFYHQGCIWPGIFQNFRKIHQNSTILYNLEGFPAKFHQNHSKFCFQNTTLWVKLGYYCAYMSVFKGRKFEISVIITYFDFFQFKTHSKTWSYLWFYQNFHIFSIQGENLLKQISNWWQFLTILTFLIPHTISYCFSTRHAYLTPVPRVSK